MQKFKKAFQFVALADKRILTFKSWTYIYLNYGLSFISLLVHVWVVLNSLARFLFRLSLLLVWIFASIRVCLILAKSYYRIAFCLLWLWKATTAHFNSTHKLLILSFSMFTKGNIKDRLCLITAFEHSCIQNQNPIITPVHPMILCSQST